MIFSLRLTICFFTFMVLSLSTVFADTHIKTLAINEKTCKYLIKKHKQVPADYVAGVDAHGKNVAGADLETYNKITLPDEITFPLDLDIAERYGLNSALEGNTRLGEIKLKGNNVYWNDQKIHEDFEDYLLNECLETYGTN